MSTQPFRRRWFFRTRLWCYVGLASLALYILAFPFHVEYFTNAGTIFCLDSGNLSVRWWQLDDTADSESTEKSATTRLISEQPGWEVVVRGAERNHPLWDSPDREFTWAPKWKVIDSGHFPEMVFADDSPRQIAARHWRRELIVPMWWLAAAPLVAALVMGSRNRFRRRLRSPLTPPHS